MESKSMKAGKNGTTLCKSDIITVVEKLPIEPNAGNPPGGFCARLSSDSLVSNPLLSGRGKA